MFSIVTCLKKILNRCKPKGQKFFFFEHLSVRLRVKRVFVVTKKKMTSWKVVLISSNYSEKEANRLVDGIPSNPRWEGKKHVFVDSTRSISFQSEMKSDRINTIIISNLIYCRIYHLNYAYMGSSRHKAIHWKCAILQWGRSYIVIFHSTDSRINNWQMIQKFLSLITRKVLQCFVPSWLSLLSW